MNLQPDETVLRKERLHRGVFLLPLLVLLPCLLLDFLAFLSIAAVGKIIAPVAGTATQQPIVTFALGLLVFVSVLPALATLIAVWLAYLKSEIMLTNKRLVFQTGFFRRSSGELPLENVEGIFIVEPLLGRLFGYGTITVTSLGGITFPLAYIGTPQVFHAALQQAVNAAKTLRKPIAKQPLPQNDSRYMPKG